MQSLLAQISPIEDRAADAESAIRASSTSSLAEFNLCWARRLSEAFDHLHCNRFDMLLLDLGSPLGDVRETLQEVHQKREIPVVVLTGVREEKTAVKALEHDAPGHPVNGHLTTDSLVRSIQSAIQRQQLLSMTIERQLAREARAKLAAIVEFSDDAIISESLDGAITSWNQGAQRMYGYSAEEVLGRTTSFLLPAHRTQELQEMLAVILRGEPVRHFETDRLRKDGQQICISLSVAPIKNSDGKITGVSTIARDISHRKQAEKALEERMRQAMLAAEIGVILTSHEDLPSTLQGCNEALVQHLGVAFSRIWTLNAEQNVLELQASAGLYTHLDGAESRVPVGQGKIGEIAQGRSPHFTNEVIGDARLADQEWAKREGMVAFAGYPLVCQDRLVGVLAMFSRERFTETTMTAIEAVSDGIAAGIERFHVVEKLRASEERFDLAVRGSSNTVWDWNMQTGAVYFSPVFKEMLAYEKEDLVAQFATFEALLHPDDRARVVHLIDERLHDRAPYEAEFRLLTKNGEYRWFHSRGQALWNAEGKACRMAGSISDITERKQMEKVLAQRDEQLRQSQKLEAVGSLAGGIAHEFSNLLQAVRGFTNFAMKGLPTDDSRLNDLEQVIKATDRAVILTRQLLGFSRRQALERTQLDPCKVVLDMVKMLRSLIGEHIDIEVSQATDVGTVCADQGLLQEMLLNLCINARDAMRSGGRLSLKTQRVDFSEEYCACHPTAKAGPYLLFSVSDNGCGMSPEVKDRIFEPFFTTKDVGKGTGLGLATVYGAVQQHGGMIDVYSELGVGTTFKVYLPIVSDAVTSVEEEARGPVHGGTETILIAEDEPMVRDVTVRILAQAGYTLLTAADGAEAVRLFEANIDAISLALLDAVMPKLNGQQVYEQIKLRKPALPVVFCSGYDPGTGQLNLLLNEGLQLVQKPFDPQVLLRAVRHALEPSSLSEAPQCIP